MFAGNFAPAGWMFCEGQLVSISEYETIYNLIGTTYGGDGTATFGLPDLRGRLPLHQGSGFTLAQTAGSETATLTSSQIPAHTHQLLASQASGNQAAPTNGVPAASATVSLYNANAPNQSLSAGAVTSVGGSQPHENLQPYLCVEFIISLFGVFPSQA
jgi:microcystin-dependent protein